MTHAAQHEFQSTVSKTNEWLKDVEGELHENDKQKAFVVLRAVLHALRDRLTTEETAHFGAQMPMLLRGVYYEGWTPADKPRRIHTQEDFLDSVRDADLSQDIDPGRAARAVFQVLQKRIDQGEINDIKGVLPHSLRGLWQ